MNENASELLPFESADEENKGLLNNNLYKSKSGLGGSLVWKQRVVPIGMYLMSFKSQLVDIFI